MRLASASDVDSLADLINAAYVVEQFFKKGDRIDSAGVAALMACGVFLIAIAPVDFAGCVYAEVRPSGRGYFGLLAVHPNWQGHGLGRRLIDAAEAHCRQAGCIAIDLRIVNLREELPAFYRRLGYVDSGTERYADGDVTRPCHFVLMSKVL